MQPRAVRPLPTILLTGFGPFPGVPVNASAHLAKKLAHLAARRFPGHRVVARELPVVWAVAVEKLEALYATERPKLALHFGVSEMARGFVIETVARNATSAALDAEGRRTSARVIVPNGPATLMTMLPAGDIVARLEDLGVPVYLSGDAGRYLCNAIFYAALRSVRGAAPLAMAGFIHIPASLAGFGLKGRQPSPDCPLSPESALAGGLEIIRTCLGRPSSKRVKAR